MHRLYESVSSQQLRASTKAREADHFGANVEYYYITCRCTNINFCSIWCESGDVDLDFVLCSIVGARYCSPFNSGAGLKDSLWLGCVLRLIHFVRRLERSIQKLITTHSSVPHID